jgi:hypothetical protein
MFLEKLNKSGFPIGEGGGPKSGTVGERYLRHGRRDESKWPVLAPSGGPNTSMSSYYYWSETEFSDYFRKEPKILRTTQTSLHHSAGYGRTLCLPIFLKYYPRI